MRRYYDGPYDYRIRDGLERYSQDRGVTFTEEDIAEVRYLVNRFRPRADNYMEALAITQAVHMATGRWIRPDFWLYR
jgi:hypothetical protein